jgi:hypothetical protein
MLKGAAGDVITLTYTANANHQLMVYSEWGSEGHITIKVISVTHQKTYEIDLAGAKENLFTIPTGGPHKVILEGDSDFEEWNINVHNVEDEVIVKNDPEAQITRDDYTKIKWNMTAEYVNKYDEPTSWYLRLQMPPEEAYISSYYSYSDPPDPDSYQLDYSLERFKPHFQHIGQVICNLKAGDHHLWMILKGSIGLKVITGVKLSFYPLVKIHRL